MRGLLVIPHLIWWYLWGVLALIVMPINWIATVVTERSPAPLHNFLAAYLIYSTHVTAYLHLIGNPFPGFTSAHAYPVSVEIDGPVRQNRLSALFRLILAQPAALFADILGYALWWLAFGGWFVALVLGRMPRGMRDFAAYCLRFQIQVNAYAMLVTPRYPSLDLRLETSDEQT